MLLRWLFWMVEFTVFIERNGCAAARQLCDRKSTGCLGVSPGGGEQGWVLHTADNKVARECSERCDWRNLEGDWLLRGCTYCSLGGGVGDLITLPLSVGRRDDSSRPNRFGSRQDLQCPGRMWSYCLRCQALSSATYHTHALSVPPTYQAADSASPIRFHIGHTLLLMTWKSCGLVMQQMVNPSLNNLMLNWQRSNCIEESTENWRNQWRNSTSPHHFWFQNLRNFFGERLLAKYIEQHGTIRRQ